MKVKSQSFVKNLIFQLSICFLVTIFVEFKYCQNRTVHCTLYSVKYRSKISQLRHLLNNLTLIQGYSIRCSLSSGLTRYELVTPRRQSGVLLMSHKAYILFIEISLRSMIVRQAKKILKFFPIECTV